MAVERRPISAPRTSDNDKLVAEIAPAMRRQLRRTARFQSLAAGMMTFSLGLSAVRNPDARLGDILQWAGYGNLIASAVFFGCALFYPGYLIQQEAGYRRRHGKWRWER
jgi:hypothetical protein